MIKNLVAAGLAAAILVSTSTQADEATALEKFNLAKELYAQREVMKNNLDARKVLEKEVIPATQDAELKYRASILLTRTFYYEGLDLQGSNKDKAIAAYDKAMDTAKAAYEGNKKLGAKKDYADAYYFYAISLGRWALLKGKLKVLGRKQELIDHCNWAIARTTQEGIPGEQIDGYGPHRTLGRMYAELPGFAGGDMGQALRHLGKAYDNAQSLALNSVYYADALISENQESKGCSILNDLLVYEDMPEELDADRVPEARKEIREGKALFNKECK